MRDSAEFELDPAPRVSRRSDERGLEFSMRTTSDPEGTIDAPVVKSTRRLRVAVCRPSSRTIEVRELDGVGIHHHTCYSNEGCCFATANKKRVP